MWKHKSQTLSLKPWIEAIDVCNVTTIKKYSMLFLVPDILVIICDLEISAINFA